MVASGPPLAGEECWVNEFDPAWGPPPEFYQSVPMRFDADTGAYAWDLKYTLSHTPQQTWGSVPGQAFWMSRIPIAYEQGSMLQPFKAAGSEEWQFRWIPQGRRVVCRTAVGSDRTVPAPGPFGPSAPMGG